MTTRGRTTTTTRGRRATAGAVLACLAAACAVCVVGARPARAEKVAVLPVDTSRNASGDGGAVAVEAAAAVRAALAEGGAVVLGVEETRRVLADYLARGGNDLASYKRAYDQAEQALAALDDARSLEILKVLIDDLSKDPEFSKEKHALLELARLKRAARLVGLAGAKETGRGETEDGRAARQLLVDALRANPKLAPSREEYPPRFHLLLQGAREQLHALGTGGLSIDSRPQGATVYVEGRDVGKTPLVLGNDVLTKGRYRVWVEASGARSVPEVIEVGDNITPVLVDLAFQGALWPEGPGLRPLEGNSINDADAAHVGKFLDVDTLVLVGTARYEDAPASAGAADWLWGASFSVREGATARRGAVRIGIQGGSPAGGSLAAPAAELARFLAGGEAGAVEDRPLPPSVLPPPAPVAGADVAGAAPQSAEGGVPWLVVGGVAGGLVVVGLGVAVTAALLSGGQEQQKVVIAIEELD